MIVRRLLHALAGLLPLHVIHAEGRIDPEAWTPLFERYFLCQAPRWLGGFTVYLHHYLRSDPDAPHDHPWDWAIAIPLAGGYLEERVRGFTMRGPRLTYRRRRPFVPYRLTGADFHRVLADDRTSWSLFVHGPWSKGWGFLRSHPAAAAADAWPQPAITRYWPMNHDDVPSQWWRGAARGRDQERAAA